MTNKDFIIYKDVDNNVKVSVMLINNDYLIAELFGTDRSTIAEHISNILKEG